MTQDKADIARRLRQTRANMLGTDDEQHYWDCVEAAAEIELLEAAHRVSGSAVAVIHSGFQNAVAEIQRLRLTDAEREAVAGGIAALDQIGTEFTLELARRLNGLLERFSPIAKCESDSPQPIATPNLPSTPAECTVPPQWTSRPYWVDPPSGHRYGFPRLYDPAKDGNMRAWMIANGYPERLANQGLACTFTAQTEDAEN